MSLTIPSSYPPQPSFADAYLASLLSSMEENSNRNKSRRLVAKAQAFFKSLPPPKPVPCLIPKEIVDFPSFLKEVYDVQKFSGLCVGEKRHTDFSPKKALIDAMPLLPAMGITTFFCEHIESGDDELATAKRLKQIDRRYDLIPPYSYTELNKKAKDVGIRVVAIDSRASAIAGCHPDLPTKANERIVGMNYKAQKIIKKEKGEGKYIIFTGSDHGSEINASGISGISELFECPLAIIADASVYRKPGIHRNPPSLADLCYKNRDGAVHAIFIMNKPTSLDSPRRKTL